MKKRRVFVVVPSLTPTGPIKGAAALCNGLVDHFPVTLVPLKKGFGKELIIDPRVETISMMPYKDWLEKRIFYQKLLKNASRKSNVISLSLCLSADTFNYFVRHHAIIISSVRGNLVGNYRFDFGQPGIFAAFMHYQLLKSFNSVIAMSKSMEKQLRNFGILRTITIGNFIDEPHLEHMRLSYAKVNRIFRFVFLAKLSKRKRPELLIKAIRKLHISGIDCCLDFVGDGPMRSILEKQVKRWGLKPWVTFHGKLSNPYKVLQQADCMVLPSETEGISRSVLEALYFGVPCILRDVDANKEIIEESYNGFLFRNDNDILEVMKKVINLTKLNADKPRNIMVPQKFRQKNCIEQYISLIKSLL